MKKHTENIRKILPYVCLGLFAMLCLGADADSDQSFTTTTYFSWWYVLGGYAAVIYRNIAVSIRHYIKGTFKWWILLVPLAVNSLLAVPLVLAIVTVFGQPSGMWLKDTFIAFTTVYVLMDITWFGYRVTKTVDKYFKKRAGEKS